MIRAHYIKENAQSNIPRRWVFLDSEAHDDGGWDHRTQTFRLAVTAFDRRRTRDDTWAPTAWRTHRTVHDLWTYIDSTTRTKARTVVVGHNLGYDLRICQAFTTLPELGWEMTRLAIGGKSVSATFKRGTSTLVLCDSMSWLPMGLAAIGGLVGTQKLDLPDFADGDAEWERRCRVDVEILRAAMMDIVQWIQEDDLGNWQPSGAGMAWATWRHRHYTHKVLVHSNEEIQGAETESIYTGRCEAWRHGRLQRGTWAEWDLPLAYPRIARDTLLPVRLGPSWHPRSWRVVRDKMRHARVLVRATVDLPCPALPVSTGRGYLWPVGRVEGWWWDVELLAAEESGATITPHEGIIYVAAPALRSWADWIITYTAGSGVRSTPVRMAAAKHQARALIGKFGTRFTPWTPYAAAPEYGVDEHLVYDLRTESLGKMLTLGDKCWIGWADRYSTDACPAIMGAIMAECRVRLWQLMNVAGLDHVAYVDTDSLIVDRAGSHRLQALCDETGAYGLRVKRAFTQLNILGPRQLFTDGTPQIAGMAKGARQVGPTKWVGESWEGAETALKRGRPDSVVITPRAWDVKGRDTRRGHNDDGTTFALSLPPTASQSATG